jgi:hypothetical protein
LDEWEAVKALRNLAQATRIIAQSFRALQSARWSAALVRSRALANDDHSYLRGAEPISIGTEIDVLLHATLARMAPIFDLIPV